ncbi:S1 domain-containing RNA-binding protein [Clostridium cellulovorans]|uniref:RNA binding S1 domain protein n=1 Tax=Clostridium cellulovorans (strain ATCC 35296 / DSM 3052 / OCM 3 / 743B) TaxID=573061 RepID=D9SXF9_CLOC7|nr:S1 domain-containing RNA-binding protein [Clostridium cellulovorans]ADL53462.1 RNA binding S1 domain protein [Clostridium cellulovorans 743B]
MALKAGTIVDGVVVNITKFGAFVEVEGKTGLVHISEVADNYVKDIKEHLKEQDKVKVKVLSVEEDGKISLSIKQANPTKKTVRPMEIDWNKNQRSGGDFEDKLSKFLKDSEERFQDIKKHQDVKGKSKKSVMK